MAGPLTRTVATAYAAALIPRERWLPFWPPARLAALQARRVRRVVRHAYRHVPFYREAMAAIGLHPEDVRSAADLASLPLVSKGQLAAEPERFRSEVFLDRETLPLRSSGTSGAAKTVHWDVRALLVHFANGWRFRSISSRRPRPLARLRVASVARAGGVSAQLRQFLADHLLVPPEADSVRRLFQPATSMAENVAALNAFRPDLVAGYGSYIGALFRYAWQRGLAIHLPRAVSYGADAMADADRRLLEETLGVPVFSRYAAVEELEIAYMCELRRGFHINLDRVAVRVIDEHSHEVGPGGTGRIVISNLTNRATVVLNYELGDIVTLSDGRCACGRSFPTIERIAGRADDLVLLPDGGVAHALAVLEPLQAVPGIVRIQVVQEDLRRFHLRVVLGARPPEDLRHRLAAALSLTLGPGLEVTVEAVDAIPPEPSGKVRAVVSRCPRPPSPTIGPGPDAETAVE